MSDLTDREIHLAGARLAWSEAGSAEANGVLLVHGFPLHGGMWRDQHTALAHDYRVLAPDLRGYGRSTLGDWPDDATTLGRYADDLAALLDAAGLESAVVVGFSMGGYIALEMLRRCPERVAALVMMDTRVIADDEAGRAGRLKMAAHAAEWGAKRIAGMMRPKLLASDASDEAVQQTLGQIESADPAAIAASQLAMAARPDSTELLGQYAGPLLAIVGEHDEISPPDEMRGFAQAAPRGEFVEIPGAGHMAPIERPTAVTDTLRAWLARI